MAIVVINEPPETFRPEFYDRTTSKVGIASDPPDGLLAHTVGQDDSGKWRIIDVWESREDYERFDKERLRPAIEETFRENGIDMADVPNATRTFYETHDVWVPGRAGVS